MEIHFRFFNLDTGREGSDLSVLCDQWTKKGEVIVVMAPHDDDGLLGAGYFIRAALLDGAQVHIVIFHSGNAGYSRPELKERIVGIRKKESLAAYVVLGIPKENVHYLDVPDFSGNAYVGWLKPVKEGEALPLGTFQPLLTLLRHIKATRLLIANGFREHIDHTAVADTGIYLGPQAGDPVVVDWGTPHPIKSVFMYSVWGQFDEIEKFRRNPVQATALLSGNKAIVADSHTESIIRKGLECFESQQEIIKGIMTVREERRIALDEAGGYMEIYQEIDPRPKFNFEQYKRRILEISKGKKKSVN